MTSFVSNKKIVVMLLALTYVPIFCSDVLIVRNISTLPPVSIVPMEFDENRIVTDEEVNQVVKQSDFVWRGERGCGRLTLSIPKKDIEYLGGFYKIGDNQWRLTSKRDNLLKKTDESGPTDIVLIFGKEDDIWHIKKMYYGFSVFSKISPRIVQIRTIPCKFHAFSQIAPPAVPMKHSPTMKEPSDLNLDQPK
ncbi:MAG: hypothetical protein CL947_00940 [Epsilonproteobacteria bacterium]|nr:hypothetical protein [Campylobacterota bacterium]